MLLSFKKLCGLGLSGFLKMRIEADIDRAREKKTSKIQGSINYWRSV